VAREPTLAAEQVALTKADEFIGEPGRSATLHESDFAQELLRRSLDGVPVRAISLSTAGGDFAYAFE
jgi:hypothetical protein